jgi:hypothetical protein
MAIAAVYAIAVLAVRGGLGRMLLSSLWLTLNIFLPAHKRRPIPTTQMMSLRLGVPLFLGTVASIVLGSGGVV